MCAGPSIPVLRWWERPTPTKHQEPDMELEIKFSGVVGLNLSDDRAEVEVAFKDADRDDTAVVFMPTPAFLGLVSELLGFVKRRKLAGVSEKPH